jgi:hypothetical protein
MIRLGERIDFWEANGKYIFRIRSSTGSSIISILLVIFFFLILKSYWVFVPFGFYLFLERFGYSDLIFDENRSQFRKRFGIFTLCLGDTYRFLSLENIKIKAVKGYESTISKIPDDEQLYVINLFYKDKKIEIYSSPDSEVIKQLFERMSLVKGIKANWEINV